MSDFKPLDMSRAIRDDGDLQRADKALLWVAVFRTDNATRKVRASLAMLAADAGYKPHAATRVFAETNLPVTRYFEKIVRGQRRCDLWFHPSARLSIDKSVDRQQSEADEASSDEPPEDLDCRSATSRLSIDDISTVDSGQPSASSAQSAVELVNPSTLQEDDPTGTGDDESTGELIDVWKIAEEQIAQQLPCGCFSGSSCPECRGDKPTTSKHSPEKLRQFHDHHLERDENLGPDGTPKDMATASTYRSRGRS